MENLTFEPQKFHLKKSVKIQRAVISSLFLVLVYLLITTLVSNLLFSLLTRISLSSFNTLIIIIKISLIVFFIFLVRKQYLLENVVIECFKDEIKVVKSILSVSGGKINSFIFYVNLILDKAPKQKILYDNISSISQKNGTLNNQNTRINLVNDAGEKLDLDSALVDISKEDVIQFIEILKSKGVHVVTPQ